MYLYERRASDGNLKLLLDCGTQKSEARSDIEHRQSLLPCQLIHVKIEAEM